MTDDSAPVATLFTGHFYHQRRRGSMHWLADELVARNWAVRFVTVGYSFLSFVTRDQRLQGRLIPNPAPEDLDRGVQSIVHITPFHPIDLRLMPLNAAFAPLFAAYPLLWSATLRAALANAKIAIVESGMPILLAPAIKKRSTAKLVYRVNDDVQVMQSPAAVRHADREYASLFDRISVASPVLGARYQSTGAVAIDPMGIDKALFDAPTRSPFEPRWEKEVVCTGTSQFDAQTVLTMARMRPSWRFHILGRLRRPIEHPNVIAHGETPFQQIPAFVQHADIGLAPYPDKPGIEYQAHHSNRLLQYAYVGLPTLAPWRVAHPDFPMIIGYDARDVDTIACALEVAARSERHEPNPLVGSWNKLCEGVLSVM